MLVKSDRMSSSGEYLFPVYSDIPANICRHLGIGESLLPRLRNKAAYDNNLACVCAVQTGEVRQPKASEWYLSDGEKPMAMMTPDGRSVTSPIVKLVYVEPVIAYSIRFRV